MRLREKVSSAGLCAILLLSACSISEPTGREKCTRQLLDESLGADSITVSMMIPDHYMSGAEIRNGGIHAFDGNCDFPLNMFLSHETALDIIADAQDFRVYNPELGSKLAEAELFIWQFEDGSEETRFFVTSVGVLKEAEEVPAWAEGHFERRGE